MTWQVKNWNKFQHFKDRRPPWIKLYRDLLDDPDWHALDGDDAKRLTMIWLIASEDSGALPDIRKLAFRLRMSEIKIDQLLNRLSHWLRQDDITATSPRYQIDTPETETETETETDRKEGEARKRASRLEKEWWPTKENMDYAIGKGLSIERINVEAEKFRNHWTAKAGRDAAKMDWNATWQNWILRACEQQGKHVNGSDRRPGESLGDLGRRLAGEARDLERAQGIGRPNDPFRSH